LSDYESLRNLNDFKKYLEDAKNRDRFGEVFLRSFIEAMAEIAPLELLIEIGHLILKFRENELKDEAELN